MKEESNHHRASGQMCVRARVFGVLFFCVLLRVSILYVVDETAMGGWGLRAKTETEKNPRHELKKKKNEKHNGLCLRNGDCCSPFEAGRRSPGLGMGDGCDPRPEGIERTAASRSSRPWLLWSEHPRSESERARNFHKLTSEKSRTMMATCARLAASATRLKSLRRASVEGALMSRGAGGMVLNALVGGGCGQLLAGCARW